MTKEELKARYDLAIAALEDVRRKNDYLMKELEEARSMWRRSSEEREKLIVIAKELAVGIRSLAGETR